MSTGKKVSANNQRSQYMALALGALFLILAIFPPEFGPLTREMVSTVCLIIMAVIFWVLRPMPILATSLLVMALQPLLGLAASLNAAFAGFTNPSNYFVIASFGFAFALQKTSFSNRILKNLISMSKGSMKKVTFAFMSVTYIISMFISDIAASVIMLAFAMDFAELVEDELEKKRILKRLLIGVPFGSLLGGTATPVGSSVNVMALNLLQQHSGEYVPFMKWVAVGLPISMLALICCWFALVRIHKSKDIPTELIQKFSASLETSVQAMKSKREAIILVVLGATVVLWVLGSWVSALNSTIVAIISMAVLFMPFVNAFTWPEFKEKMSWEIPVMGAATISLGTLAVNTGLIELIVGAATTAFNGIGMFMLVVLIGLLISLLLMTIPVGPTMVSMLTVPSYMMAQALGFNPVLIILVVGIFASNSTILPLNSVVLVSYSKGYWKTSDLAPVGILTTVAWLVLAGIWIPIIGPVLF